ncbi:hypothetical protein P7D22_19600 [Lichenihabitans sp. Uapishka_5]|uniref:hypothetical protein n=1 Tax=Lichenihabitans sp. Uapishka_5 TaxID=3037302 RepID=UPI0029E7F8BE|nr:hypothetical protein [Lichenihabitans sp. Uapishka_5]MDX7953373.1 hypothetical protein [Lichenihabitans sp. Uapishka_5]
MAENAPNADQAVIDAAVEARRCQQAYVAASERAADLDEATAWRFVELGECPVSPADEAGRKAVNDAMIDLLAAMPYLTPEATKAADELGKRTLAKMWGDHNTWRERWREIAAEVGSTESEREHDDASNAEVASIYALADIRATTWAGVLAKASVFEDQGVDDDGPAFCHEKLALSIARDLKAMATGPTPPSGATTA